MTTAGRWDLAEDTALPLSPAGLKAGGAGLHSRRLGDELAVGDVELPRAAFVRASNLRHREELQGGPVQGGPVGSPGPAGSTQTDSPWLGPTSL